MKLKTIKIIGLIEIISAYISLSGLSVILFISSPELFECGGIWLILGFSIVPVGATYVLFIYFNSAINNVKSNINHLRAYQNYCYKCGADISEMKKAETCPNCNTDLNFIEFLLKLDF